MLNKENLRKEIEIMVDLNRHFFRCLKDWKINVVINEKYSNSAYIDKSKKYAIIYVPKKKGLVVYPDGKKIFEKLKLKDYILHELLHICISAISRNREKEEVFINDIIELRDAFIQVGRKEIFDAVKKNITKPIEVRFNLIKKGKEYIKVRMLPEWLWKIKKKYNL